MRRVSSVAWVVVLISTLLGPLSARAESIALVPLLSNGFGADEIARDELVIRSEVDAHYGARSMPADAIRKKLDAAAQDGMGCDRSTVPCLVQLGIVVGADRVLLAALAPDGPGRERLALRLVDVGEGSQLAFAHGSLAGGPRPETVSALLAALERPEARALSVDVRGPAGARVLVDGKEVAVLPLAAPLTTIAAGRHEVRIVGDDVTTAQIDVRPGEPVLLAPPPPPKASQPASPPEAAAAPAPAPAAGLAPSTITALAGGGVAAAGLVAVVVGLVPRVGYELAAGDLDRLNGEIGSDPKALVARAGDVKAARAALDGDAAAWTGWGAVTVVAGVAVLAAGGAVAGGALALE